MKAKMLLFNIFIISISYAQIPENTGLYLAKEFSKEEALYKAKDYIINQVIGGESNIIKFEIDPLAAASSGELTSLVYKCEQKNLSGLVLGFYGITWNESGIVYEAYAFKNLPQPKALEILSKIAGYIDDHSKYLGSDMDNNNIFFKYDDMTFLIYIDYSGTIIRVFWNGFDSEWESTAFERTKNRFEKKVND